MLLDNAQIELDQFQENGEITQRMVDRYTRNLVKEAMESEARRKNYILSWAFYTMIANGVEYMEFPEQKKFIRKMMNPAYRIKGSSKGSIFDDVEIDNILGGYGIGFNQELTGVVIDYVQKGMFMGAKNTLPSYKYDSPFTVEKAIMGFSHEFDRMRKKHLSPGERNEIWNEYGVRVKQVKCRYRSWNWQTFETYTGRKGRCWKEQSKRKRQWKWVEK